MKRGNRESTIKRKLRYLKHLKGSLEDMTEQVLKNTWKDRVKSNALDVIMQYAEFLNVPYVRPSFRAYDNSEMYVPNPDMVKKFVYRVRSKSVRARIMIAIETGGSASMVLHFCTFSLLFRYHKKSKSSRVRMNENVKEK